MSYEEGILAACSSEYRSAWHTGLALGGGSCGDPLFGRCCGNGVAIDSGFPEAADITGTDFRGLVLNDDHVATALRNTRIGCSPVGGLILAVTGIADLRKLGLNILHDIGRVIGRSVVDDDQLKPVRQIREDFEQFVYLAA